MIPQLLTTEEVAIKMKISKNSVSRIGLTQYRLSTRIIRYKEDELTALLKRSEVNNSKALEALKNIQTPNIVEVKKRNNRRKSKYNSKNIDLLTLLNSIK